MHSASTLWVSPLVKSKMETCSFPIAFARDLFPNSETFIHECTCVITKPGTVTREHLYGMEPTRTKFVSVSIARESELGGGIIKRELEGVSPKFSTEKDYDRNCLLALKNLWEVLDKHYEEQGRVPPEMPMDLD